MKKFFSIKKRSTKVIAIAMTVVVCAGIVFYACEKDLITDSGGIKSHKSSEFYDQELLNRFMEEPLVRDFREHLHSFEIKIYNGILHFRDEDDVLALYETLIEYSDRWDEIVTDKPEYEEYINSDKFPNEPILYAFEAITGFYSLRTSIENQLLRLEEGDGISSEEDPDDHFIVSPYMRTILTPACELIIEETIYIIGDEYTVEISDLNMDNLRKTQDLIRTLGEEKGMMEACLEGYADQSDERHKSDNCCNDVTIKDERSEGTNGCNNTYTFSLKNNSSCGTIRSCKWDFGDGSAIINSSGSQSVKYTYKTKGNYTVKAQVTFSNGTSCNFDKITENIKVDNCNVKLRAFEDVKGVSIFRVSTGAGNCDNSNVVSCKLTFGDGSDTTIRSSNFLGNDIRHQYTRDGRKIVTVEVTFESGCVATDKTVTKPKGTGACCKANDRHVEKEIIYSGCSNKKIKHIFAIRNILGFHRFVVRSIHFEKNKKGKWKREKADRLYVNYGGIVYNKSCEDPKSVTGDPGKTKTKQVEITMDKGNGTHFRAGRNTVYSIYEVNDGGCNSGSQQKGISLHDNKCP
jgi:PKD repeat protein